MSKEGFRIEPNAVAQLVEGTQGDIRQILMLLSMYKLRQSSLGYDDAKALVSTSQKNFTFGPFDLTPKLLGFERGRTSVDDAMDYFFCDYSIMPLMIQENYLSGTPAMLSGSTPEERRLSHLEMAARAADLIAEGDVVSRQVMQQQEWGLLPTQGLLSTVFPSYVMHGSLGGRVEFAGWLGKNSTQSKNMRIARELYSHSMLHVSADRTSYALEYMPHIFRSIVRPLEREGTVRIALPRGT